MNQRFLNIIRHYKNWKHNNPDTWVSHCVSQNTLEDCIYYACISVNHLDKKHPHQYRLTKANLESFANSLIENQSLLQACTNFDDLVNVVRSLKVKGIGELAVYDASVRIGEFLRLYPEQIYLHAGARVGAEGLVGAIATDKLSKDTLPEEFRNSDLTCYELEDLMCIYKKMFLRAQNTIAK